MEFVVGSSLNGEKLMREIFITGADFVPIWAKIGGLCE